MRIVKVRDYQDMSKKAADIISAQVVLNPSSVLGLATGSTPEGIYQHLAEKHRLGDLDFKDIKTVNLDEYKGISKSHPQSYTYYMKTKLFNFINIKPENTYLPDGDNEDGQLECKRYRDIIQRAGGIDLQLLGLGNNGHIGFNEPGEAFEKEVHCVDLSETTITANARFFYSMDEVPKQAYTMGIGNIMRARKIVVVVSGKEKAEITQKVLFGPVTPKVPGSILQLHSDVTVIADEDALSLTKI